MAEYQLTAITEPCAVIRQKDQACIPADQANRDYAEYLVWKEAGGVPDPYVPPPPVVPQATVEMTVMYDHENRLRTLEGAPAMKLRDFLDKMKGG